MPATAAASGAAALPIRSVNDSVRNASPRAAQVSALQLGHHHLPAGLGQKIGAGQADHAGSEDQDIAALGHERESTAAAGHGAREWLARRSRLVGAAPAAPLLTLANRSQKWPRKRVALQKCRSQ